MSSSRTTTWTVSSSTGCATRACSRTSVRFPTSSSKSIWARNSLASPELSTKAVGDVAFVYAGLYLQDYKGSPEAFREALRAARTYSQGVMLFDLVHLEENGWWGILYQEFKKPRTAPHDIPDLLMAVRR